MRVAILHDWLVTWRGGELCLDEIAKLFGDVEVFTMFHSEKLTSEKLPNIRIHSSLLGRNKLLTKRHRLFIPFVPFFVLWMSYSLNKRHRENPFELVISISHCGVKNVLIPKGLKHICYCLTPVRYVWDQFENYVRGAWYERLLAFPRYVASFWDKLGSRGVDTFVSISDYVVKRVNRYYGRDSLLVYPPVIFKKNENFDLQAQREYFLVVNALVPYKNTHLAVRACTELNLPLKVVGSGPDLLYLSKISGTSVEFLGQVSDQKLIELYLGAKALIFCAEEDFGIVPLEANSYGTPVIFYGKGGLSETQIEGDQWTGRSFNKLDTESLKVSIDEFLRKEPLVDRKFCKENAKRFSLERFKREIMEVVNASLN